MSTDAGTLADDPFFWAPRRCLREPISEIFEAACFIDEASNAHIGEDGAAADRLIGMADISAVREWIESLWGGLKDNPNQSQYHRHRELQPEPLKIETSRRDPVRMPSAQERRILIERDGWNCAYCGIPLIHPKARDLLRLHYPALRWGPRNRDKHAAFQCMTPEYDHVVPHCYGGTSSLENTVMSCGPCNCGKWDRLLAHHGLLDPRDVPRKRSDWDGLTRLLKP